MAPKKQKCGICSEIIKSGIASLQCNRCDVWFHGNCLGLKRVDFNKTVQKIEKEAFLWACQECKSVVRNDSFVNPDDDEEEEEEENSGDGSRRDEALKEYMENLFVKHVAPIRKDIDSVKSDIKRILDENKMLKNKIKVLEGKIEKMESLGSREGSVAHTEAVFEELAEREQKKKRVIAFNVPESLKAGGIERQVEDKARILQLTGDLLVGLDSQVKVTRIGKPTDGKKRPVVIDVGKPEIAEKIIRMKPEEGVEVRFKADLTKRQRDHLKQLKMELGREIRANNNNNNNNNIEVDNLNDGNNESHKPRETKMIKYVNGIPRIVKRRNFRQNQPRDIQN